MPRRHERRGARDNGVKIEIALGRGGEAVDERGEFGVLAGLNEAEVALRQRQRRFARQRAEDGNVERSNGVGDERAVPFAADAV